MKEILLMSFNGVDDALSSSDSHESSEKHFLSLTLLSSLICKVLATKVGKKNIEKKTLLQLLLVVVGIASYDLSWFGYD